MTTAVLALQGAFAEHESRLKELGETVIELRDSDDCALAFDRLILPGGESTVQSKLLKERGMDTLLRRKIEEGMPTFGTCAGMILLAQHVDNGQGGDTQSGALATFPACVRRNAYGRQLGSFHTVDTFADMQVPMTFIRAPYLAAVEDGVSVLSRVDGNIVAARWKNQLVTAFHPEVDSDTSVHEYFLHM